MKQLQIRQERANREWTLDHVSKQAGVTKAAIYDIETGRRKPSYDVLLKLLAIFGRHTTKNEIERLFAVAADQSKT